MKKCKHSAHLIKIRFCINAVLIVSFTDVVLFNPGNSSGVDLRSGQLTLEALAAGICLQEEAF